MAQVISVDYDHDSCCPFVTHLQSLKHKDSESNLMQPRAKELLGAANRMKWF